MPQMGQRSTSQPRRWSSPAFVSHAGQFVTGSSHMVVLLVFLACHISNGHIGRFTPIALMIAFGLSEMHHATLGAQLERFSEQLVHFKPLVLLQTKVRHRKLRSDWRLRARWGLLCPWGDRSKQRGRLFF